MKERKLKVWALLSGGSIRRVVQSNEVAHMRKAIRALGLHFPEQELVRAALIIPGPKKRKVSKKPGNRAKPSSA